MIDMPENTHHRRTVLQKARVIVVNLLNLGLLSTPVTLLPTVMDLQFKTMTRGQHFRSRFLNALIHRGENPHLHQFRDKFERLESQFEGEITHHNRRFHVQHFLLSALNIT